MIPRKKSAAILQSVSIMPAYCTWNFGVGGGGCGWGMASFLIVVGLELAACESSRSSNFCAVVVGGV